MPQPSAVREGDHAVDVRKLRQPLRREPLGDACARPSPSNSRSTRCRCNCASPPARRRARCPETSRARAGQHLDRLVVAAHRRNRGRTRGTRCCGCAAACPGATRSDAKPITVLYLRIGSPLRDAARRDLVPGRECGCRQARFSSGDVAALRDVDARHHARCRWGAAGLPLRRGSLLPGCSCVQLLRTHCKMRFATGQYRGV